jgi:hypothetical protein
MAQHPLINALTNEDATEALVIHVFQWIIEQPLSMWLKPEAQLQRLQRWFDVEQAGKLFDTYAPQFLSRLQDRMQHSQDSLRDWVIPELDAEFRATFMRPVQFSQKQLHAWLYHDVTEHVMRDLVKEILERFIQSAKPGGQGGGLLGMASRGALGWASRASKGVLNGIGDQLEQQLKGLVAGFIQSSMQSLLERLGLIISTPEVAMKLGKARLNAYESLLHTSFADLWAEGQNIDWQSYLQLIPELIDYHLNREAVQQALIEEFNYIIEQEGDQPIRTFLGSDETIQKLQTEVCSQFISPIIAFAQSQAFQQWIDTYLESND